MLLAMLLSTCLYMGANDTQFCQNLDDINFSQQQSDINSCQECKEAKIAECKRDIQQLKMTAPKMDIMLSHQEMDEIKDFLWNKPGTINVITKFISKIDYIPEKCVFVITFDFTKSK